MGKPDPNASDWSDLDLLTIDEAIERLDAEIAAITATLAAPAPDADRDAAQKRLALLTAARDRAGAGPTRPLYQQAQDEDKR